MNSELPGKGTGRGTGNGDAMRERPADEADGAGAAGPTDGLNRRDALKLLGMLPLAALPLRWTQAEVTQAIARVAALPAGTAFAPRFFTAHEYAVVRLLADMVIPADERSGSASSAGVPEFMDFMMGDGSEARRVAFRGGLAWLDAESRRRNGKSFVEAGARARAAILDDIAWPAKAPPTLQEGVAFFSAFRDLVAAGFFSSELGHRDLRWVGNVPVMQWTGCGARANAHALRSAPREASS